MGRRSAEGCKLLNTAFYCRTEARHASDWKNETEGTGTRKRGLKKSHTNRKEEEEEEEEEKKITRRKPYLFRYTKQGYQIYH
jgi:hypothetical protein